MIKWQAKKDYIFKVSREDVEDIGEKLGSLGMEGNNTT